MLLNEPALRAGAAAEAPTADMAWIPGGAFRMGSDAHYPEESPVRHAAVDGFFIDRDPVTNRAFARFVAATGYVTVAERPLDPASYPGVAPDMLQPGSLVFMPPADGMRVRAPTDWWDFVLGANWRHPAGPGSALDGRED
ncbi:MAG TPA: SUMF1/EgtB/PvdO family nonheme iron enzyme, partial [Stellaceae bacterium]|nr:SUMF1/EgtB/PvdO family nonheme iron enzyme [Stellaceae bacterium]